MIFSGKIFSMSYGLRLPKKSRELLSAQIGAVIAKSRPEDLAAQAEVIRAVVNALRIAGGAHGFDPEKFYRECGLSPEGQPPAVPGRWRSL